LFECLCGRAPFASRTYDELLDKIQATEPIQVDSLQATHLCASLISKLLERDPRTRLSFKKFYQHPFLDMSHAPSPSSLPAARDLVEQAVSCDKAGEYQTAVQYYKQSLDHFIAAIHYEESDERKEALRAKVNKYMSRAEELQTLLRDGRPRLASGDELIPCQTLMQMSSTSPRLKSALIKLKLALDKDEKGEYSIALGLYENALEALMSVYQDAKGRLKELLLKEVEKHMKRAEEIKNYLKVTQRGDRSYSLSTSTTATQSTPTLGTWSTIGSVKGTSTGGDDPDETVYTCVIS